MCLGAVALTIFLSQKVKKYTLKATTFKAIASLLFVSLAAYGLGVKGNPFGVYVVIALACGLIGDIFLDLKYDFPSEDKLCTYVGFIAFALGHVLYITGMFVTYLGSHSFLYALIPLVIGVVAGTLNMFIAKPLKLNFGNYKVICWIYGTLLFSLTACSLSLSIAYSFQSATINMLIAGGVLFAVSDLILSGTYFGEGKERPFDIISNAITYYLAQYVIAFSIMF